MKQAIIIGLLAGALFLIGIPLITYNSMVSQKEEVDNAYANIETQLQRRSDLIPNLVNSVKGYMKHEEDIIASITESREKLMNAQGVSETAAANDELTAALENFNLVVENYPDLKASENFIQLQDELAGTENRIATARRDYNNAVKSYNTKIKKIPAVFFAGIFGFHEAEYFEATEGSNQVPDIEF